MKFSSFAGFAAILVLAGAGCVAAVSGNPTGTGGSGGTGPLGCGTGLTMCGTCVNTTNDASHCGGCNKPCAGGQVCDNGVCATTCSSGSMLCGASCANISSDPAHCGNCTTMCRADQTCTGGSCACPAGQSLCGNGVCAASCSTGGSGGTTGGGGAGGTTTMISCPTPMPGRAPLRRLTTFEYNNTVRDLLADSTNPGNAFPAETLGDGFGNNADEQSVADSLAREYGNVAEGIAARATANATALGKLASCASTVTTANEEACARTIATSFLPRAYRRTVTTAEVDEHVTLYRTVRGLSTTLTFASGVAAIIEAALQSPDFIYRVEFGTADAANPAVKKLTGRELASRLSYFFWQTMPDTALNTAADGNMLGTAAGVLTQATRLLDDPKAHPMVAFFFDNVLPLRVLTDLARDPAQFPTYSATIGQAMRQETQRVLEYEIFENTAMAPGSSYVPGSWPAVLTAPYTFVNQSLFNYYGAGAFAAGTAAVTGATLQKVSFNATQRMGLLTQGAVMTGTTTTNLTNPVLRGGFVMNRLMCRNISFPTDPTIAEMAMRPVPYTGWTARERYSKHSAQAVCNVCHQYMDPVGLALENFDAVGLYRTVEHATINGETRDTPIDTNGMIPGVGTWANALELSQKLAASEEMQTCFSSHWMQFAYGRTLDTADACNKQSVNIAFKNSGYNIKKMLLALTQADAFLYRPAQ